MKGWFEVRMVALGTRLLVATMLLAQAGRGWGQARPTARQTLQVSAFAGAAGVYTGLDGGKNLSFSAGVDVGFRPFFGLNPAVEVRGMYPVKRGSVDSQKNVLGGLLVGRQFGVVHPYADFLFGRGEIDYAPPYPVPSLGLYYSLSTSNVFSPGVGVDLDVTRRFGVRADVQYQRYATPVTSSGSLYAKPITFGIVYRLDLNRASRLPNR